MASFDEDVGFDITRALASIDKLEDALNRSASQFRTGMLSAIDDLRDVRIEIDTAGVSSEIQAAIDAANGRIRINPDTSGIPPAIDDAIPPDVDVDVDVDVDDARRNLRGLDDDAQNTGASLTEIGAVLAGIGVAGAVVLRQLADAASDLNESTSKAQTTFGDLFADIAIFGESAAASVGLSNQAALEATATFGGLLQSLGGTQTEAARLSPQIVQLGADLASFNNLEVDDALEKIRSGLIGEIEPLRALGVSFDAAAVEAKALALGLADANGEIDEGAKVQARFALILEQTTLAQGDFARTSGGLANQQRTLAAEFQNFVATAGQQLLPIFLDLTAAAREELLPRLSELADRVLPAVIEVMGAAAPAGGALLDVLIAFAPALTVIATLISALPPDLIAAVATFAIMRSTLGQIVPLLNRAAAGLGALGRANPFILAASAALAAYAVVSGRAAGEQAELADQAQRVADALSISGQSFDTALGNALSSTGDFTELLQTLGAAGLTVSDVLGQNVPSTLLRLRGAIQGLGVDESTVLAQLQLLGPVSEEAAAAFLRERVALGELTEAQVIAATGAANFARAMEDPLLAVENLANELTPLVETVGGLSGALEGNSKALEFLDSAMQSVALNAGLLRSATDGITNDFGGIADGSNLAVDSLGQMITLFATGQAPMSELATIAGFLGVDLETLTGIIETTQAGFEEFTEGVLSTLPTALETAGAAFVTLEDGSEVFSLQAFRDELQETVDAAVNFGPNIQSLIDAGFSDLASLAAQRGPEFTQQLVDAINSGEGDLASQVNHLINVYDGVVGPGGTLPTYLTTTAAPAIAGSMGELGAAGAAALGLTFDPSVPVEEQLAALGTGLPAAAAATGVGAAFEALGVDFGQQVGAGLVAGLTEVRNLTQAEAAAQGLATAVIEGFDKVLLFGSPSKVMIEKGRLTAEGFAIGLHQNLPDLNTALNFDPSRTGAAFAAGSPQAPPSSGFDDSRILAALGALAKPLVGSLTVGHPGQVDGAMRELAAQKHLGGW